jgi:hypothetical protein
MKHFVRFSALAVSVLAASTAFAAAPQRTFVASTGSDTNPCTLTAPCRGFQMAIDAVAAGGEVVAIDSAGYGPMEIHKSVSVIVPPGVHAGLSPLAGIPLPGFPGQTTVVLIDIQSTDTVVLRGLNVNHQGTVTGGIHWLSANGGIVHVENTTVNGFPYAALFMGAPGGKMFVKDSIFRNNGYGIYLRGITGFNTFSADHVRIENSTFSGLTNEGLGEAVIRDSVISANAIGIYQLHASGTAALSSVTVDRCVISHNALTFKLFSVGNDVSTIYVAASTLNYGAQVVDRTGPYSFLHSLGNNSLPAASIFNGTYPLQ